MIADLRQDACRRCGAYNQHLQVCLRPATKRCTDSRGLRWYACDELRHDTKIGSENVVVERLTLEES